MNKWIEKLLCISLFFILFSGSSLVLASPVPVSGQTAAYAPGDDGTLLIGVTWPDPRFVADLVEMDSLTGLRWAPNGDTPTIGSCTGGTKTWLEALQYVACLNSINYLDYDNWRLPNINELKSLFHAGQSNQATWLNTQGFSNVQAGDFWSSTTYASITDNAWLYNMNEGFAFNMAKSSGLYVWPVRTVPDAWDYGVEAFVAKTGQTTVYSAGDDGDTQEGADVWDGSRFTVNYDATMIDMLTGLVWAPSGNFMPERDSGWDTDGTADDGMVTWQHALEYVAKLNDEHYLGYDDWRLPNRKELESLASFDRVDMAGWLNSNGFTSVKSHFYWSSTSAASDSNNAWYVTMGDGFPYRGAKSGNYYVWPVRGGKAASFTYLTVGIGGMGRGTLSVDKGAVIWNGSIGWASYGTAATVNITAAPDDWSSFWGWYEGCSGTGVCTVTMDANKYVAAQFDIETLNIAASPSSLPFGEQIVNTASSAQTVTLTNNSPTAVSVDGITISGAHYKHFTQTNDCPGMLGVGQFCTASVTFAPTWKNASGLMSAALNINVSSPATIKAVPLTGTVVQPVLSVSPASLSFGEQTVKTVSEAQTVTITNSGTGSLALTGITISGTQYTQFTQTNNCPATLSAGASCTANVKFAPKWKPAGGSMSAALRVSSSVSTRTVTLSGMVVQPVLKVSPSSLSFGEQIVNTASPAQTVTITNSGTDSLALTVITFGGTHYTQFTQTNNCPATLSAGASCTANVKFAPKWKPAGGSMSATLSVSSSVSTKTVTLSGTVLQPVLKVSPSSLSFGSQAAKTVSEAQTVTITNSGTDSLALTGVTIGGTHYTQFIQTNDCPATLSAGASCTANVKFAPKWKPAGGSMSATLSVSSSVSTKTVTLSGTVQ
jgi:hypothetical protein